MQRLWLAWVCVVSALLVLTVGTVAGDRLTGVGSLHPGGSSGLIGGDSSNNQTGTGPLVSPPPPTENSTSTAVSSSLGKYVPPAQPTFVLWEWLLYGGVGLALAAGFGFLLRSSGETGVYDFAAAMEELNKQRLVVEGSWSRDLRNVALLRYYSLMRRTCSQLGLADSPSETSLEYLGRVASVLKVSHKDAADFASAFDRARYGGELSGEDARNAAASMSKFVTGLRESLAHG